MFVLVLPPNRPPPVVLVWPNPVVPDPKPEESSSQYRPSSSPSRRVDLPEVVAVLLLLLLAAPNPPKVLVWLLVLVFWPKPPKLPPNDMMNVELLSRKSGTEEGRRRGGNRRQSRDPVLGKKSRRATSLPIPRAGRRIDCRRKLPTAAQKWMRAHVE